MEEKKRLVWLDICKGIGVFFIILSHTPITRNLVAYNYSFQLGIFFFISGYLFSWKKFNNFKEFFKSRVKSILLPYFWLSLISVIFYLIYYRVPFYDYITFKNMAISFFWGARNTIFYNIPLWFLPTLFLMENFYYLLKRYWKNNIVIFFSVLYLSMLGFIVFSATKQTNCFWTWKVGMYYLIYFTIGNLIREYSIKLKNKVVSIILFLVCLFINISMYFFPNFYFSIIEPQSLSFLSLKTYFVALIIMLAGTYVFIQISQKIKQAKGLEYISKHSLIFFGLHVPVMWCIRSIFNKFHIQITQKFNLEGLIYTILIIFILSLISLIYSNCVSFLAIKRKRGWKIR